MKVWKVKRDFDTSGIYVKYHAGDIFLEKDEELGFHWLYPDNGSYPIKIENGKMDSLFERLPDTDYPIEYYKDMADYRNYEKRMNEIKTKYNIT